MASSSLPPLLFDGLFPSILCILSCLTPAFKPVSTLSAWNLATPPEARRVFCSRVDASFWHSKEKKHKLFPYKTPFSLLTLRKALSLRRPVMNPPALSSRGTWAFSWLLCWKYRGTCLIGLWNYILQWVSNCRLLLKPVSFCSGCPCGFGVYSHLISRLSSLLGSSALDMGW